MITELGKFLRNLRMDKGELLKNMADRLDISSAYLSAIETGKREVPKNLSSQIKNLYNLSEDKEFELDKLICVLNKNVDINISNATDLQTEAALVFARDLERLSDKSVKEFLDFIGKRKDK